MFQLRAARQIPFKLNPVKLPDMVVVMVAFDKGVQFAIGHVVKYPAVGAQVMRGFRQVNSHSGIAR